MIGRDNEDGGREQRKVSKQLVQASNLLSQSSSLWQAKEKLTGTQTRGEEILIVHN